MSAFDQLLESARKLYLREGDPDPGDNQFFQALIEMAVAGAMHAKDDHSKPTDLLCALRAVTDMVRMHGTAMTLCQLAQIAGVLRTNNGGATYACISHAEEGEKPPFTVLLFANRANLPPDQVAEHILRRGNGIKPERKEF
jgi:hypothetical protein